MVDKKIQKSVKEFRKYWKDYDEQKYKISNYKKDEPTFKQLYVFISCCIMIGCSVLITLVTFSNCVNDKQNILLGMCIGLFVVISLLLGVYNFMLYMHPELKNK